MLVVVHLLVLESPFYFYATNQKNKATEVLLTVAAYNKKNEVRSIEAVMGCAEV